MNFKYKKGICIFGIIVLVIITGLTFKNHNKTENTDILLSYESMGKTIEKVDFQNLIQEWYNTKLVNFMKEKSGLEIDTIEYLNEQCKEKNLDPFFVLGLMKLESNFKTNLISYAGARGLGQLMDNTAKPWANNLGLEYSVEKLYEPKYNIQIFTSHLQYLFKVYNNDVHQILTAYNRGQGGLKKYVASRSNRRNPAESTYSNRVLQLGNVYREEFENNQSKASE